jgi:hypothetical protein
MDTSISVNYPFSGYLHKYRADTDIIFVQLRGHVDHTIRVHEYPLTSLTYIGVLRLTILLGLLYIELQSRTIFKFRLNDTFSLLLIKFTVTISLF